MGGYSCDPIRTTVGGHVPQLDDTLAGECESFLAGRWAVDGGEDRLLPRWAWLDQVAHGDLDAIREAAARPSGRRPGAATTSKRSSRELCSPPARPTT